MSDREQLGFVRSDDGLHAIAHFRCGMDNIVIRCSCPGGTCTCTKNGADAGTPAFGACGDQTSLCNADSFPLAECGVSL